MWRRPFLALGSKMVSRDSFVGPVPLFVEKFRFMLPAWDYMPKPKRLPRNSSLEPWETIAVGALSGGLAAVVTTPFDVMKTRMMTAKGRSVSMSLAAISILRHEGPLGLFKGAVPRFFWIASLGAMNFAGYDLPRKAMDKKDEIAAEQPLPKKPTAR